VDPVAPANNVVMLICPNLKCRRVLQVPEKHRGQAVRCRYCHTTFSVPITSMKKRAADPIEKAEKLV
jgi:hypothetical protein